MKARWSVIMLLPFAFSFALLSATQFVFVQRSLYADLGLGRMGDTLQLANYYRFFSDSFYLENLLLTIKLSLLAVVFTLLLGFPIAYVIARMRSRWATVLLAGIVVTSFVTIVIKVYGIVIMFSANGLLNRFLIGIGLIDEPYSILGNQTGVVVGLMYFSLGFAILLLYGVIQTIPRSLEEAAQVHGASRFGVQLQIVIPLSLPGVTVATLMIFNLCMGAFTSAALLGAGRVLTLPVLIQRTIIIDNKYAMGGTLAFVLLVAVMLINILSVLLLKRWRFARHLAA
jgi:putative spermidine/putrescine transport system permease protein